MLAKIVGLALSWRPGQAVYIPLAHDSLESPSSLDRRETLATLQPLLEDPLVRKSSHDIKRMSHIFQNHDIEMRGWNFDIHLASYVLNSVAIDHSLEKVSGYYVQRRLDAEGSLLGSGRKKLAVSQTDPQAALAYLAPRVDMIGRLRHLLSAQLAEVGDLVGLYKHYELDL